MLKFIFQPLIFLISFMSIGYADNHLRFNINPNILPYTEIPIIPVPPLVIQFTSWDFEHGLTGWEKTGTAFNSQPTLGNNVTATRVVNNGTDYTMPLGGSYWTNIPYPIGHKKGYWIGTYEDHPDQNSPMGRTQRDIPTGTLTSTSFILNNDYITFLIGGGYNPNTLKIELLEKKASACTDRSRAIKYSDGNYCPVRGFKATGWNTELMRRSWWNVQPHKGKTLRIRIVDNARGSWGHINVDDIRFQNERPDYEKIFLGRQLIPKLRPHNFNRTGTCPTGYGCNGFIDWDMPVWGVTDMHTHPASHLGFGQKLMFGNPDGNIQVELANCNAQHGGHDFFTNQEGNYSRSFLVSMIDRIYKFSGQNWHNDHPHAGWPNFSHWPHFTTITHQQMRQEWLHRAQQGGLRVIVALAVNNQMLANALDGKQPKDDKQSANEQIEFMRNYVGRHNFMEIAYDPNQLLDIVRRGKLAVVLGIEVDNIGNFHNPNIASDTHAIRQEIKRLFDMGIRYIFPVHVTNNQFGGAAVYQEMFNLANKDFTGREFRIETAPDPQVTFRLGDLPGSTTILLGSTAAAALSPVVATLIDAFSPIPGLGAVAGTVVLTGAISGQLASAFVDFLPSDRAVRHYRSTPAGRGHRNSVGLTPKGRIAVNEMMRLGMMIDMDHMSEKTIDGYTRNNCNITLGENCHIDGILDIAERVQGGYPINSGHNRFRRLGGQDSPNQHISEHQRTVSQQRRVLNLGGVMGVRYSYHKSNGSGKTFLEVINTEGGAEWTDSEIDNSCGGSSRSFAQDYLYAIEKMAGADVALGTDVNGLVAGPGPRYHENSSHSGDANYRIDDTYKENHCVEQSDGNKVQYSGENALLQGRTGNRRWDINYDGVAHYGLLPDFFQDLHQIGLSAKDFSPLFNSADHFARMWSNTLQASNSVSGRIINLGGYKCLDIHAPDIQNNGGKVQIWDCNEEAQQQWIIKDNVIKNSAGKCLEVRANQTRLNGGIVQISQCNGQRHQQWYFGVRNSIVNADGKCLDINASQIRSNGGRIQVWDCNGYAQQQWGL